MMNELKKAVLESVEDHGDSEEQKLYMQDVMQHGCISGIVGELIYYGDTLAYYAEHKKDILALLDNLKESTGLNELGLFGDRWDELDPRVEEQQNMNLLAWFGYEETTKELYELTYGAY